MAKSKHMLAFEAREAARAAARRAAMTPADHVAAAQHRAARLAELAGRVQRMGGGVLDGAPSDLEEICRMFGFRNPCTSGRVYLTPRKMRELFLPAGPCAVCDGETPADDRLPLGDGVAHAACTIKATIEQQARIQAWG